MWFSRKTWKIVSKAILFTLKQQTIPSALILSPLLEFSLISRAADPGWTLSEGLSQKRALWSDKSIGSEGDLMGNDLPNKVWSLFPGSLELQGGWGERRGSLPSQEPGLRMKGGNKRLSASRQISPTRETTISDLEAVKWRSIANNWAN